MLTSFFRNSELETLPEEFNTEGTAPLVTRVAAHPKYGVLGWGYDVTGNYMSHGKGVTLPVIEYRSVRGRKISTA